MANSFELEGGCDCGKLRYRMVDKPIIVHCCHCRWCQRETGSAFALNAMIEAERVELLAGQLSKVPVPSASGRGQVIVRCPECQIAVWSHYGSAGEKLCLVRVGSLDNPDALPPDVQIYTDSKQPWIEVNAEIPSFGEYYKPKKVLSAEMSARLSAVFA